jgi:hypothetical protein
MTLRHAAAYLDVTVWALRERIWAGALPVVRFREGGKLFLDVRDLDDFVDRNKRTL